MARVRGQGRIEHARHLRMAVQELGNLQGIGLVLLHAHRQGADAAQGEIGIVGADGQSETVAGFAQLLCQSVILDHYRALHHVGVTRDVLGGGQDRDVSTQRQRTIQITGRPGIVGSDQHAAIACACSQGRQVGDFVEQRTGCFEIEQLGPRLDQRIEIILPRREVAQADAQPFQQALVYPAQWRIDAVLHQGMVTRRQQGQQGQCDGRQARWCQQAVLAALQCGDGRLQRTVGVQPMAAVSGHVLAGGTPLMDAVVLGHVGVAKCTGPHDRYIDRPGAFCQARCTGVYQCSVQVVTHAGCSLRLKKFWL